MKIVSLSALAALSLSAALVGCAGVPTSLNDATSAATSAAKAEANDATAEAKAEATDATAAATTEVNDATAAAKAEVVAATTPHACPMGEMCPITVKGTTVTATDTTDGASLVFVTTGDVEGLRTRVKAMAAMHAGKAAGDMKAGMGKGMGPGKGMGMGPGMAMKMPASTAVVTDSEGGATLTFTPTNAADLPAVREHAKKRAAHMTAGCPLPAKT